MTRYPRIVVAQAYDQIAEIYLRRFGESAVRQFWLDQLIARLPTGARVLDLGCGAGLPVARDLHDRGFVVTGIDGSRRQIELARGNVPGATFIQTDMTGAEFAEASFGAVTAFYAMHARLRVHRVPGIPRAFFFKGRCESAELGRVLRRGSASARSDLTSRT